jgi:hypothetical protein
MGHAARVNGAQIEQGAADIATTCLVLVREVSAALRSDDRADRETAAAALDAAVPTLTQQLADVRARDRALKGGH